LGGPPILQDNFGCGTKLFRDGGAQTVHISRESEVPGEDAVLQGGRGLIIEPAPSMSLLAKLTTLRPLACPPQWSVSLPRPALPQPGQRTAMRRWRSMCGLISGTSIRSCTLTGSEGRSRDRTAWQQGHASGKYSAVSATSSLRARLWPSWPGLAPPGRAELAKVPIAQRVEGQRRAAPGAPCGPSTAAWTRCATSSPAAASAAPARSAPALLRRASSSRCMPRLNQRNHCAARGWVITVTQFLSSVITPAFGAIIGLSIPQARPYVATLALVITVTDVSWIDRSYRRNLKDAAKISEQSDCELLNIPWNKFIVGRRIDPESIDDAAKSGLRGKPTW
jgi:virulence-associated protein VagC